MSNATAERRVILAVKIEEKPTTKGKTMWRVIDKHDDFYSIFDEFVRSRISEGKHNAVMVKVETRGGKSYKNIVGIAEDALVNGEQTDVGDLLPGAPAAPAMSPKPQQSSPPPPPQTASTPRPAAAARPVGGDPLVTIRAKGLELAVSMFNANRITHDMIEPNADEFTAYIAGEQKTSSRGGTHDDYIAK